MPYSSFSRRKVFVVLILFLLPLGITLSVLFINEQQDIRQRAAVTDWIEVGIHPQAVNMPTATGKSLQTLTAWNGKLYAGYGDYNVNLGPTAITGFDPVAKTFTTEHVSDTEAIFRFRQIFGKPYAPSIDPMSGTSGFAVPTNTASWIDANTLYTTHAFDMATLTGSDLWLVGAYSYDAVAWRSTDGGITWQEAQREHIGTPTTINRYYWIFAMNNKIYIQDSQSTTSKIFDGATWSNGPNIRTFGSYQTTFAGKAIFLTGETAGQLRAWNGIATSSPFGTTFVYDIEVYGEYLYVLTGTNIQRTKDLATWSIVTTDVPTTRKSIALADGKIYIGTSDSKIYEHVTPVSTLPMVTLETTDEAATENNDSGTITLKRTGDIAQPLTVSYDIEGTASNGVDYTSLSGQATIPAGQTTVPIVISPAADGASEGNESIILKLKISSAYDSTLPTEARVIIYAAPPVDLSTNKKNVLESGGQQNVFTLTRSGSTVSPLPVIINVSGDATNGTDYTTIPSTITIPAGQTTISIPVNPLDDAEEEGNETVTLSLVKNANYSVVLPYQAKTTIVDNDASTNPNIILNPSFEQLDATGKPLNWSIGAGNVDKTVARTGQNSIKINGPSSYAYFFQAFNPTPSKIYVISAWIKTNNVFGRGGGFRFVQTASTSAIIEAPWLRGTNDWTYVTLKQLIKSDFTAGRLDLWTTLNNTETVWFDDIRMAEAGIAAPTSTPTPAPPLTATPLPPTLTPTPTITNIPTSTEIPPTFTPTPSVIIATNTPFPSPTPPSNRRLMFTFLLNGVGLGGDLTTPGAPGNQTPLNPQRTVTLEFSEAGTPTQVAMTTTGTITFNQPEGTFTGVIPVGTSLPDGNYIIRIKTLRYIKKVMDGTVSFSPINVDKEISFQPLVLVVGDTNDNGGLDIFDFNIIVDCFSINLPPRACADANKKTLADLNDDGKVNGVDLNLFIRNIQVRPE